MTSKYDAFIVTKPLQYINVLNIQNSNNKILLLIDSFYGASSFYSLITKKSKYWDKYLFFSNIQKGLIWLIENSNIIDSVYIDSDINNKILFYKLRHINLCVYEEGVGTYMKRLYKPRRPILGSIYLLIQSLLGYKNRRGGNKYTRKIIVYHPEFYRLYIKDSKIKIDTFQNSFINHLATCAELSIFNYNIDFTAYEDKIVSLYIPSWEISHEELLLINQIETEYKILKPHPHFKKTTKLSGFDQVISTNIPAELVIIGLLKHAKLINIFSQFSSATIYFIANPKIKIYNFPQATLVNYDHDSYHEAYTNIVEYILLNSPSQ